MPISHRFRDKRRFKSNIANFSHPVYLAPPLTGFPWKLSIGARGHRTEKEVWRYLQPSGYNTPTWPTDRQTRRNSKDRNCALRRAGKKTKGTRATATSRAWLRRTSVITNRSDILGNWNYSRVAMAPASDGQIPIAIWTILAIRFVIRWQTSRFNLKRFKSR